MASVFRSRGGQGEQFQDQTLHGERGDTVGHAQLGRSPPGHCGHAQIAHDVHLAERPCEPFEQLNPARVRLDRQNVCAYPPEEVAVQLAWRLGENSRCRARMASVAHEYAVVRAVLSFVPGRDGCWRRGSELVPMVW
jgi:hypothetical protein